MSSEVWQRVSRCLGRAGALRLGLDDRWFMTKSALIEVLEDLADLFDVSWLRRTMRRTAMEPKFLNQLKIPADAVVDSTTGILIDLARLPPVLRELGVDVTQDVLGWEAARSRICARVLQRDAAALVETSGENWRARKRARLEQEGASPSPLPLLDAAPADSVESTAEASSVLVAFAGRPPSEMF